ncbi:MAG TPA: hypothetical protein VF785_09425 [Gemmatimonadaceae bacterium]
MSGEIARLSRSSSTRARGRYIGGPTKFVLRIDLDPVAQLVEQRTFDSEKSNRDAWRCWSSTKELERKNDCIIPTVFHRKGKPIGSYAKSWETACKKASLEGRLVHDLRRSAVRNLERAGVSRSVAMKLTGHRTEAVYRRYAITSAADLAEGVAKLAVLHGAPQGSPSVLPFAKGTIRAQSAG